MERTSADDFGSSGAMGLARNQGLAIEKSPVSTRGQPFIFHKRVFLKDTNAEGNVYFTRYFEWQGEAREDFLRIAVPSHMELIRSGTKMITVHSWIKYKHETYLFDEVSVEIRTTFIRKMSLELVFTYINDKTNEVIAIGGQKLAFADPAGKLIPIPTPIRDGAATCLIGPETKAWHMELIAKKNSEGVD